MTKPITREGYSLAQAELVAFIGEMVRRRGGCAGY